MRILYLNEYKSESKERFPTCHTSMWQKVKSMKKDNKTLGVVLFLGTSQPFLLLASVPFWLAELVTQSTWQFQLTQGTHLSFICAAELFASTQSLFFWQLSHLIE